MTVEEIAKSLGINASEVREKQRLMTLIVDERKKQKLSQTALAKKLKLSQGRIAQIESGIGTNKVTFDVLLNILNVLGYDFKVTLKKSAA